MRHQSQATTPSMDATKPAGLATGKSRWLVVAVSLCGALAGASIVEALAALTSHSNAPISPDHLIAAPLAMAGAICGGLLAAVLVSKEQRANDGHTAAATEILIPADTTPGEPMFWQPTPSVISRVHLSETAVQMSSDALRMKRVRRAIRQHGYGHHHIHSNLARPATRL